MSQSNEMIVSEITVKAAQVALSPRLASDAANSTVARDATKDAGRVRMGAGMQRF